MMSQMLMNMKVITGLPKKLSLTDYSPHALKKHC